MAAAATMAAGPVQTPASHAERVKTDQLREHLRPMAVAAARDPAAPFTNDPEEVERVLDSMAAAGAKDPSVAGRVVTQTLTVTIIGTHLATYWAFVQWLQAQTLSLGSFDFGGTLPHLILIGSTGVPIVARFFPKAGAWMASFFR